VRLIKQDNKFPFFDLSALGLRAHNLLRITQGDGGFRPREESNVLPLVPAVLWCTVQM